MFELTGQFGIKSVKAYTHEKEGKPELPNTAKAKAETNGHAKKNGHRNQEGKAIGKHDEVPTTKARAKKLKVDESETQVPPPADDKDDDGSRAWT